MRVDGIRGLGIRDLERDRGSSRVEEAARGEGGDGEAAQGRRGGGRGREMQG